MSPHGKPMQFTLRRPCGECPFLQRNNLHLRPKRAEEIAEGLEHNTFQCHMQMIEHCAGALIIMLKQDQWGDLQQIAMRMGLWTPSQMDLDAQVFDSFDDFVRFYGGTVRGWRLRRRRG